jgi:hypothetical protein
MTAAIEGTSTRRRLLARLHELTLTDTADLYAVDGVHETLSLRPARLG